jgi:hypothetical protein
MSGKKKKKEKKEGAVVRCGRDRMVVGFITTYVISANHHH